MTRRFHFAWIARPSPRGALRRQACDLKGVVVMSRAKVESGVDREVRVAAGDVQLDGELKVPAGATGIVLFAHGSGSSRHSPRNQYVAGVIRDAGVGTLLFDLL